MTFFEKNQYTHAVFSSFLLPFVRSESPSEPWVGPRVSDGGIACGNGGDSGDRQSVAASESESDRSRPITTG